jgi:hypothetical protein
MNKKRLFSKMNEMSSEEQEKYGISKPQVPTAQTVLDTLVNYNGFKDKQDNASNSKHERIPGGDNPSNFNLLSGEFAFVRRADLEGQKTNDPPLVQTSMNGENVSNYQTSDEFEQSIVTLGIVTNTVTINPEFRNQPRSPSFRLGIQNSGGSHALRRFRGEAVPHVGDYFVIGAPYWNKNRGITPTDMTWAANAKFSKNKEVTKIPLEMRLYDPRDVHFILSRLYKTFVVNANKFLPLNQSFDSGLWNDKLKTRSEKTSCAMMYGIIGCTMNAIRMLLARQYVDIITPYEQEKKRITDEMCQLVLSDGMTTEKLKNFKQRLLDLDKRKMDLVSFKNTIKQGIQVGSKNMDPVKESFQKMWSTYSLAEKKDMENKMLWLACSTGFITHGATIKTSGAHNTNLVEDIAHAVFHGMMEHTSISGALTREFYKFSPVGSKTSENGNSIHAQFERACANSFVEFQAFENEMASFMMQQVKGMFMSGDKDSDAAFNVLLASFAK